MGARGPGNSVRSRLASSTSSAKVLDANSGRHGALFANDDANVCKLHFGPGPATATDYSVLIPANGTYTLLPGQWAGPVYAIWGTAGSGGLSTTELT